MSGWLAHAPLIVACTLQGGLLVLFALETLGPRRRLKLARVPRWWQQLALHGLGAMVLRACVPIAALEMTLLAEQRSWGLLHLAALSPWLATAAGVLAMDLGLYAVHRLSHAVPLLWRIHQVHHSDLECDVSTAIRHHPLEVLFDQSAYLLLIAGLGIAPLAVLIYASAGLLQDLLSHSNLAMPPALDRALRMLIVTPDMHRIHHSADCEEGNRNFASSFPCWDRLFGTYLDAPALGQEGMRLGLADHREPAALGLWPLLRLPFIAGDGGSAVPRAADRRSLTVQ